MKIVFVLTDPTRKIAGGYKIIYQYANYLKKKGYDVEIIYRCYLKKNGMIMNACNIIGRYIIGNLPIMWFDLDRGIKRKVVTKLKNNIHDSLIVATAYVTAQEIHQVGELEKNNRIAYLIQDFETWVMGEELIVQSFGYGYVNLVISKWLRELVDQYSVAPSVYIPNGIEVKTFRINVPFENRKKHSIAMLYHTQARKGTQNGIRALKLAKEEYPNLTVELFGSVKAPKDLPAWIHYTQNANQEEVAGILNKSQLYLMTSVSEGFGLPGLEAIACGCVLVTTPCDGVFDYARDAYNAVVINGFSEKELLEGIKKCFDNEEYMVLLSKHGQETAQQFTLEKANARFLKIVENMASKMELNYAQGISGNVDL